MEDIGLMNILVWGAIGAVVVHLFMKVRNNEINKPEEERNHDLIGYNLNGYDKSRVDTAKSQMDALRRRVGIRKKAEAWHLYILSG